MARVHPTAQVAPGAELAGDVEIGPYAIIGPRVTIGAGTTVGAYTIIDGRTRIGRDNRIFAHSSIGGPPQDKKYGGEDTRLEIGDRNTIREFCTFNTGTAQDAGVTRIGSDNWVMAYVHVAHDCVVGNQVILANSAQIAGHVEVGDWAILGGMSGAHQFVRIGAHAMVGGGSIVLQDLPPFVLCNGNPAAPFGMNVEGLKRRGFPPAAIAALRRAYKAIYKENRTVVEACAAIDEESLRTPEARTHLDALRDFLRASTRGIVR